MRLSIDTTTHEIYAEGESHITYRPGSPMDHAIRVVEKLLRIHYRSQKQGSIITQRTR